MFGIGQLQQHLNCLQSSNAIMSIYSATKFTMFYSLRKKKQLQNVKVRKGKRMNMAFFPNSEATNSRVLAGLKIRDIWRSKNNTRARFLLYI